MRNCCHLAVAGDVYHGVFIVLSFFPRNVLDEILDLIEIVSEIFLPSLARQIKQLFSLYQNRSFMSEGRKHQPAFNHEK